MSSLLILGPGYTAKVLATLAEADGWRVITAGRSSIGYPHIAWDALESDTSFESEIDSETVVVYSVPTLFKTVEPDQPHLDPVVRALEASEENGAKAFIYLSSTAVYGNHDGDWVDEDSERKPTSPFGIMRRDIEDLVLSKPFGYVVRIVGIYGPGRTLIEAFERGRYRLVNDGEKISNRVHVDDLARVVLAVAEQQPEEKTFIACDGSPVSVKSLVDWLVEHQGVTPPDSVSLEAYERQRGKNNADRWRNTIRCRNERVRDVLGLTPRYPDVLAGYRSIFENTPVQKTDD